MSTRLLTLLMLCSIGSGETMPTGKTHPSEYHLVIEDRPLTIVVPETLTIGSSGLRREVRFFDQRFAFAVRKWNGKGLEIPIGTFYSNRRSHGNRWDFSINIYALLLIGEVLTGDIAKDINTLGEVYDFKAQTADGKRIKLIGRGYSETLGSKVVIVLESAESTGARSIALDDRSGVAVRPFKRYFVRLSVGTMLCVEVAFDGSGLSSDIVEAGIAAVRQIVGGVSIKGDQ